MKHGETGVCDVPVTALSHAIMLGSMRGSSEVRYAMCS